MNASSTLHAFGTGREIEIGARVRIDDGLEGRFRLGELERRLIAAAVLARDAHEVPDHRNVGIEDLRRQRRRLRRSRRRLIWWRLRRRWYLRRRRNLQRPSSEAPRLRGFQASELPGFRASQLPGFQASQLPGFQASQLPGFQASQLLFQRLQSPLVVHTKLFELGSKPFDFGARRRRVGRRRRGTGGGCGYLRQGRRGTQAEMTDENNCDRPANERETLHGNALPLFLGSRS